MLVHSVPTLKNRGAAIKHQLEWTNSFGLVGARRGLRLVQYRLSVGVSFRSLMYRFAPFRAAPQQCATAWIHPQCVQYSTTSWCPVSFLLNTMCAMRSRARLCVYCPKFLPLTRTIIQLARALCLRQTPRLIDPSALRFFFYAPKLRTFFRFRLH